MSSTNLPDANELPQSWTVGIVAAAGKAALQYHQAAIAAVSHSESSALPPTSITSPNEDAFRPPSIPSVGGLPVWEPPGILSVRGYPGYQRPSTPSVIVAPISPGTVECEWTSGWPAELFRKARSMNADGNYFFNSFSHLNTFLLLHLQDDIAAIDEQLYERVKQSKHRNLFKLASLQTKLAEYCNPEHLCII